MSVADKPTLAPTSKVESTKLFTIFTTLNTNLSTDISISSFQDLINKIITVEEV